MFSMNIINDPGWSRLMVGKDGWMDAPVSVFAWRRSPVRGGGRKVYPGMATKEVFLG